MATRVNTKFILILAVTLIAAGGIVGGLVVLQLRGDTSRHIKAGDSLMTEGQAAMDAGDDERGQKLFENALKQYGRAVRKEPIELSHLRKLESALASIRPTSQDRATELEGMRMEALRHEVRYRRQSAESHLKLIRELHTLARQFNQSRDWELLADSADDMHKSVSPLESQRDLALLYRGMGRMRALGLAGMGAIPTRTGSVEEIEEAEGDLLDFVAAYEQDDLGWATLAESRMSIARQRRVEGLNAEAEIEKADETMRQALEAVPDGPEVARVAVMRLALRRVMDQEAASDEDMAAAIDRLEELARESDDPVLLAEVAEILRATDLRNGLERAIELMSRYVNAHPGAHYQRLQFAQLCYMARDRRPAYLDDASAAAEAVIAAEPAAVSTLSRIQSALRIRAAGLLVDIAYRRWLNADDADKPARLEEIVSARNRLAGYVAEPEKDSTLVNADGKIAAANDDYATAADKFEKALRLSTVDDFDTLWNSARCLDQIGQYGLACDRFAQAYRLRPGNIVVLNEKARLEYRIGRYDDARESAQLALQFDPDNEQAHRVLTAIESTDPEARQEQATDASARVILRAQEAATDGAFDAARDLLVSALPNAPDKLPLLSELVRVEVRAGKTNEALAWLDQALEIQPNNQFLRRLKVSLGTEDQIEALKLYLAEAYADEADRVVHTSIQLAQLAREMNEIATRMEAKGDDEEARSARDRATAAGDEAERFLARAREIAADHPALIDHLFNQALIADEDAVLESLVEQARTSNADQTDGLIYKGRLELHRKEYERAVQTLTEATKRKPYSALAWRMLGRAYERLGNFGDALRAYEEAYSCNPNDALVMQWYVALLIQTGDRTRALRLVRHARRTVPRDTVLQEIRLQLEAATGDLPMAIQERRWIYEQTPRNRINAMRLVALLSKNSPTFEHLLDEQGAPEYGPGSWSVLPEQARVDLLAELAESWREEADQIIAALESESGDSREVATLRSEALKARGEIRAGEQVLVDYCARHPEDLPALFALGRYQASVDRVEAAIATYEGARAMQSDDVREADHALADLMFNQNQWAQAQSRYRELADVGADRAVLLRLAECHLKLREYDEAATVLDRAVAADGPDFFTAMLAAGIADGHGDQLMAQGNRGAADRKYAEADAALDEAESLAPRNPLPQVRRAQRLVQEYGRTQNLALLDDAMLHLDRAEEAAAGNEAISRVRVEIFRIRGDQRGAIGELRRLLKRRPDSVPARKLLIQLYAQTGNQDRAMATIDEAIRMNPTIAVWHEAKGDLFVIMGRIQDAPLAFRESHLLQPSGSRLAKYAETALAQEPRDYAAVAELVSTRVDLVEGRPLLRCLYARSLSGIGSYDAALDQMGIGYEEIRQLTDAGSLGRASHVNWLRSLESVMEDRDPVEYERFLRDLTDGQPGPVEMLWIARYWISSGPDGLTRAIEVLRTGIDECPADDPALRAQMELDLGQFLVMAGEYVASAEAFERVLEIEPDNILALNNAAFIYVEHIRDYEKALRYGEKAAALMPDENTVLDTLGWAYFRVGRYEEAEEYLRRSIKARPTSDNHCHLAWVLVETAKTLDPQPGAKRLDTARTYLSRSAELGPSPELQVEIDRLAEEIRAVSSRFGRSGRR